VITGNHQVLLSYRGLTSMAPNDADLRSAPDKFAGRLRDLSLTLVPHDRFARSLRDASRIETGEDGRAGLPAVSMRRIGGTARDSILRRKREPIGRATGRKLVGCAIEGQRRSAPCSSSPL